jgi:AraC family transcriptional regulator
MQKIRFDHNNAFNIMRFENNVLVFSDLKGFHRREKSSCFAIRYVTQGVEHYNFYGQDYPVGQGQYLMSNACQEGYVEIDEKERTTGICIGIDPDIVSAVVATSARPDTAFSDLELASFFCTSHFLENKYNTTRTILGQFLESLSTEPHDYPLSNEAESLEFFYTIAEKIVADHVPIFKQLQAIPSLRTDTKKDLFRRVARGKDLIDTAFNTPLSIETIAKEACLSEYHFFRLFKTICGVSPHQYILKKRFAYAHDALSKGKTSVSDVAFEVGFSDIFTFSKAFKKHFGYPPSQLLKQR